MRVYIYSKYLKFRTSTFGTISLSTDYNRKFSLFHFPGRSRRPTSKRHIVDSPLYSPYQEYQASVLNPPPSFASSTDAEIALDRGSAVSTANDGAFEISSGSKRARRRTMRAASVILEYW